MQYTAFVPFFKRKKIYNAAQAKASTTGSMFFFIIGG